MPRRKITVEEAFATLQDAGIPVQIKPAVVEDYVESAPVPVQTGRRKGQIFDTSPKFAKPATTAKVTLFAKHSVGSGGVWTVAPDGTKHIESAGIESYGPGICTVPIELAPSLLHADMLAREADRRLLDSTHRSFLVMQRQVNGYRANVGIEVDNGVLDGGLGTLPDQYMYMIR